MKILHSGLESFKTRKESMDNIVVQEAVPTEYDQKMTIVNFLATVVAEAEALGISYERIFHSTNSFVEKPKTLLLNDKTTPEF